jgi:hypothetical protein
VAPGRIALQKEGAGYYLQASQDGGEPPGRWWGPGAEALGFQRGQVVEREPYDLLFGQRQASDGTPLGRPPGGERKASDVYAQLLAAEPHATAERQHQLQIEAAQQARQSPLYFDLTVSLSKSISIFHSSLGENARRAHQAGEQAGEAHWSGLVTEVDQMIYQAVWAGFGIAAPGRNTCAAQDRWRDVPWYWAAAQGTLRPPRGFRYGGGCRLTDCGTAIRRGWMTSGSRRCSSPSGWVMRFPAWRACTAMSCVSGGTR